ncbi:Rbp1 [Phodopus roborovskii]|uniref:Rbp1 protein n=1 Tax=Phodopus roborovskii TaxID=109678 RepID=A0AAU9YTG8_PHORO|nr:Rbp1 [Phodopus roborovskii]
MPVDFNGYWKMLSNENFEEYLRALDVNVALRKIANLLKPDKEIVQDGDHMIIRTLSTFRNYIMDFQVGKEFEEDLTGIDDRKCMCLASWVRKKQGYHQRRPQWEARRLRTTALKSSGTRCLQSKRTPSDRACLLSIAQDASRPLHGPLLHNSVPS